MSHKVDTAIILAGGLGTRLRSSVPDLPKPMAPIKARPFLEYQMEYWVAQGISKFILSVGYRREVIIEHFSDGFLGANIDYAIEETPLGTGGGLLLALELLEDNQPVLVLNGDTFFEVDLEKLSSFHQAKQSRWTFSLFRTADSERYLGMDVSEQGRIIALKSDNPIESIQLANGGIYLIEPETVKNIGYASATKVSLEEDILATLLQNNIPLYGVEFDGLFIDIGIPEDYRRASNLLCQE